MHATGTPRPGHSLSARLLWVTVAVVLAIEALIFLPVLSKARRNWIGHRLAEAHLAAIITDAPPAAMAARDEMLRRSGIEMIAMTSGGVTRTVLPATGPLEPSGRVDFHKEDTIDALADAARTLLGGRDVFLDISTSSPLTTGARLEMVIRRSTLAAALRVYAGRIAMFALVIALITGAFVFLAVHWLFVLPMRRMVASIAAFRAAPERTAPFDPSCLGPLRNDELAIAGQELAQMQRELRAALWRNARLAAVGTMAAKFGHDLRGILSPALLVADRLQMNGDASVRRAGKTMAQCIERATDLLRRALDFARDGPAPPGLAPVRLARIAFDAAEMTMTEWPHLRTEVRVPPTLEVQADRDQLFRVLANLLRNAAEAGARTVRIGIGRGEDDMLAVDVTDDGPGLPESVRAALFRPFNTAARPGGTGLGLAIARDLMRAHGGDLVLAATGPEGTSFRLLLPVAASAAGGIASAAAPDV